MSDHLDSSDNDLEDLLDLVNIPKCQNYFESIVPQLDDRQFMEHFRITRQVTQQIADHFDKSEYFHYQDGDSEKVSALKFVTVFLWFAGNEGATYRDVADRFNISKSTLFKIIRRMTYYLSNLSLRIIKWPNLAEQEEIDTFFAQKGFPGVIGVIDGTHIQIDRPADDPDSYLNRKGFHSLQAQMVCDHKKRIRDIFVGYPGSVHDSRVLKSSPLYASFEEKCGNRYILGDSGYPCLKNLLTPFKDRGNLNRRQKHFNYLLSKNRYIIEHCFGILKQKFRQLYHLKLRKIPDIVHFIRACAVLHNLSIDDEFVLEEVVDNSDPQLEIEDQVDIGEDDRNGVIKRNEVMGILELQI